MGTPSLGFSPDTKALLYLCLRTQHSKKQLLGHCSDPLKLMGLNHSGVSHQLQKNYTRDESGVIIFLLCALQKDDLLSRRLHSVFLSKLTTLLSVSYSMLLSTIQAIPRTAHLLWSSTHKTALRHFQPAYLISSFRGK